MKKLPILLALILFSSIVNAQFGGGFNKSPGGGFGGGPEFGGFGGGPGGFGFLDYANADDITGNAETLIHLKFMNLLLGVLPQGRGVFKEACVDEESKQQLINTILENYNSNVGALREICDNYKSRADNFNEKICSPDFDIPIPPHIKRAAEEAGVELGLSMTPDDIRKVCEIEFEKEMEKQKEFERERFKQEAERFLEGCKERQRWDEERERREEERRKEEERRWEERDREFEPFGPPRHEEFFCPAVEPPTDCYPCGPEYDDRGCATGRCVPCEQPSQEPWCGDGICNEDPQSCEQDCGPQGPMCGDGRCEGGEDSYNCSPDCGSPPQEPFCGDGICNEDPASCEQDCGPQGPFCGDGICNEDPASCEQDCGPQGPFCGDGICNEDPASCEQDCGPVGPVCGNGVCDGGEDSFNCPSDCGSPEPFCGDGVCNEDPASCEQDCGAQTAGVREIYSGVISFQDFDDFGPGFGGPDDPFGGPEGPGFGPGFGFDDDRGFGPPPGEFDPGFHPFGERDDFGPPGFGGPGDPFGGPGGPGFGPGGPDFGGGAGPDFGPGGPGGPGFGPPGGFGMGPFDDSDCDSSVEELIEKISEFSGGFGPGPKMAAQMCEQMAVMMGEELAQMRLQKELHEESCKLKVGRKSIALREAADACFEAIEGTGVKELITDTVNAKCDIIELRKRQKSELRESLRAAVGIFDVAEENGSVALESTALTLTRDAQQYEAKKKQTDFVSVLLGNNDQSRAAAEARAKYEERIEEIEDQIDVLPDRSSQRALEDQVEELEAEVAKAEKREAAYKDIGGILDRLFGAD